MVDCVARIHTQLYMVVLCLISFWHCFKTGSDKCRHGKLSYIYIFITEVTANRSCAGDFRANMPCIIISLTHLFVSLGIGESKKGIFSAAWRRLLNEGLPRQQSSLLTAFAHQRKPDKEEILTWLDTSFREQKSYIVSHYPIVLWASKRKMSLWCQYITHCL